MKCLQCFLFLFTEFALVGEGQRRRRQCQLPPPSDPPRRDLLGVEKRQRRPRTAYESQPRGPSSSPALPPSRRAPAARPAEGRARALIETEQRAIFTFWVSLTTCRRSHIEARCARMYVNDPSAGSPTETLLRLLLPLNDQVWSTSQQRRRP